MRIVFAKSLPRKPSPKPVGAFAALVAELQVLRKVRQRAGMADPAGDGHFAILAELGQLQALKRLYGIANLTDRTASWPTR